MIVPSPPTVRRAAIVVSLEGLALVAVAALLIIRHLAGTEDPPFLSGYGTAAWFVVMGSGVLASGFALWTGRRWGRGAAVFAQLLLLPIAWYMAVDSGRWIYGVPVALVAATVLALLFSPSALQWLGQDSAASTGRSSPDTR